MNIVKWFGTFPNNNYTVKSIYNDLWEDVQQGREALKATLFYKRLANGTVDDVCYRQYLADLLCIYRELESGLKLNAVSEDDQRSRLGKLAVPELFRVPGLVKDLQAFSPLSVLPSSEALNYAAHLQNLGTYQPIFLTAHAFARYFADLDEGQKISDQLTLRFLDKLEFYNFKDLCKAYNVFEPSAFIPIYKDFMDGIPLLYQEEIVLIKEVQKAFSLQKAWFDALSLPLNG